MKRKEIFWFAGTIIPILIIFTLIFGIEGFKGNATLDINIHDTYFVIANNHFLLLLLIFVFFGLYLIRAIRSRFRNLTLNLILMISTILVILVLSGMVSVMDHMIKQESSWTLYPPLSADEKNTIRQSKESNLEITSSMLFIAQIALLLFLAFCGFKTGRNYNRSQE